MQIGEVKKLTESRKDQGQYLVLQVFLTDQPGKIPGRMKHERGDAIIYAMCDTADSARTVAASLCEQAIEKDRPYTFGVVHRNDW